MVQILTGTITMIVGGYAVNDFDGTAVIEVNGIIRLIFKQVAGDCDMDLTASLLRRI